MPRIRRRGHRERVALTRPQREILLFGTPILNAWPSEKFESEEQMFRAWQEHRAELLAEFAEERPGKRPWAWHHFEGGKR